MAGAKVVLTLCSRQCTGNTGQMHNSRLLTHPFSCQVGWPPVPPARLSLPTLAGRDVQAAMEKQKEPDP